MKNTMKQVMLCVTIAGLFVLAGFAQSSFGVLGPENARVPLLTAPVLPPAMTEMAVQEGPIVPPDPIDIPARAAVQEGPIVPPDPIDIPARAAVQEGPIVPPDPIDIPART